MSADDTLNARIAASCLVAFHDELVKGELPADVVSEAVSAFIQAWIQPAYEDA